MTRTALIVVLLLVGCATAHLVCEEVKRAEALVDHFCPDEVELCREAKALLHDAKVACGIIVPPRDADALTLGKIRQRLDELEGNR